MLKKIYISQGIVYDCYGVPVLCEILCYECYRGVVDDDNYFPEPYTSIEDIVSFKPLKCDMCGREIKTEAYLFSE